MTRDILRLEWAILNQNFRHPGEYFSLKDLNVDLGGLEPLAEEQEDGTIVWYHDHPEMFKVDH